MGDCDPKILFLAGILHDLGILVIYQQEATLATAVERQINDNHLLRDQAECGLLGFDHAEVGAMLIKAWGLPEELSELTRCHHQYQLAQNNQTATTMLALANLLAATDSVLTDGSDVRLVSLPEQLGLSPNSLADLAAKKPVV